MGSCNYIYISMWFIGRYKSSWAVSHKNNLHERQNYFRARYMYSAVASYNITT